MLYELYTGSIAFPGRSNNEMLKLMIEVKGPFPKKMLKRAMFKERHFDQDLTFGARALDPALCTLSAPKRTLNRAVKYGL